MQSNTWLCLFSFVPEWGTTTWLCQLEKTGFVNKTLTVYRRQQLLITELEVGAVGINFPRQRSWWAREVPGRARTCNKMTNKRLFDVFWESIKLKKWSNIYQDQIFLDETGCVLSKKMMPNATVMVSDLEISKKVSNIDVYGRKMWWYPGIT
jgi:hypothetical protein